MAQFSSRQVSDAERRLGELLESAPTQFSSSTAASCYFNRMAEQIFRYTRLVPERLLAAHVGRRTRYMEGPVTRPMGVSLKLEMRRKDSHFPVEISLSPTTSDAGLRAMAIFRDITDRKQMEDQLRAVEQQYIQELELNNRESDEASRVKSEFLSGRPYLSQELAWKRKLVHIYRTARTIRGT